MTKMGLIIATLLISATSLTHTDVISITEPSYSTPNSVEGVLRPKNGLSMNDVEQQFGQPESKSGPVGDPPITTWKYPNFSVFFEYNLVIHSVVAR